MITRIKPIKGFSPSRFVNLFTYLFSFNAKLYFIIRNIRHLLTEPKALVASELFDGRASKIIKVNAHEKTKTTLVEAMNYGQAYQ